jgi:hypothetical protein
VAHLLAAHVSSDGDAVGLADHTLGLVLAIVAAGKIGCAHETAGSRRGAGSACATHDGSACAARPGPAGAACAGRSTGAAGDCRRSACAAHAGSVGATRAGRSTRAGGRPSQSATSAAYDETQSQGARAHCEGRSHARIVLCPTLGGACSAVTVITCGPC